MWQPRLRGDMIEEHKIVTRKYEKRTLSNLKLIIRLILKEININYIEVIQDQTSEIFFNQNCCYMENFARLCGDG